MHILLLIALVILGSFLVVKLAWRLLVGKPETKKLVAPDVFKPTRGKKGADGIYQLSEAQFERLTKGATEGVMFMNHLAREGDDPKVKEALVDQNESFADLQAEGLVQVVDEKQYSDEVKKHMKELDRPLLVMRITDQAYKMFKNPSKEVN